MTMGNKWESHVHCNGQDGLGRSPNVPLQSVFWCFGENLCQES